MNTSIQKLDSLFQFLSSLDIKQMHSPVKHGDFIFCHNEKLHWIESITANSTFTAIRVDDQKVVTLQIRHIQRFASKHEISQVLNSSIDEEGRVFL